MIQAYRDFQNNLQYGFYIKVLNTNNRVQTQRKLKPSSKYNKVLRTTIKVGLTSCPQCAANWPELHGEDGTHSTVQPGGSGCPTHDAQTSSKSAGTQPAQKGSTTTLSILILSKAYPTLGILSPMLRHARFLALEVYLAEKGY